MSLSTHLAEGGDLERLLESTEEYKRKASRRYPTASEAKEYELAARETVKKRLRIESNKEDDNDLSDPPRFAERYLQRLVKELAAQNMQTRQMVFKHYEWMLPQPDSTPQQLGTFELLHRCAMVVSDADLASILSLQPSMVSSPPTVDGANYLYLRSWAFSATELQSLIDHMVEAGHDYAELNAWQAILDVYQPSIAANHAGAPTRLHVRYVGICEGPKRPFDRHEEDLQSRKSGIMCEFYGVLERHLPQVLQSSQIYVLPNATIPADSWLDIGDHERMAIQLLNPDTLLNRQRGGYFASYLPPADDSQLFQDMKTDFWARFGAQAGLPPNAMQTSLHEHFRDVQQYANGFPAETGTGTVAEFSDNYRSTIQQEATPYQYKGTTVMEFLGKDVTREDYVSVQTFISGKSRAGHLTRDFIYRLARSEGLTSGRNLEKDRQASDPAMGLAESFNPAIGAWCFVNLWPWLWQKNKEQAISFLQTYLGLVKPIVVNSYSAPVNQYTMSDFGGYAFAMGTFTQRVAKPTIQFYRYNEDGTPDNECAFINIPHLHPGKDKHGSQDLRLRRVFDLTMQYTFLIGNTTLDCLDRLSDNGQLSSMSRFDLCQQVLKQVRSLVKESPSHKRFHASIQQARAELLQHWQAGPYVQASRMQKSARNEYVWGFVDVEDERPRFTEAGYRTIEELGQAIGAPDSPARWTDLESLWKKDLPDLHIIVPREEKHKANWFANMASVPEGQYYFLFLLAQQAPDAYTIALLNRFKPVGASSDWLRDSAARKKAASQASELVSAELSKLDRQSEGQMSTKSPQEFLKPAECHGRRIQLSTNGLFYVRVINSDGMHNIVSAVCRPAIPTHGSGLRYMIFTPLGIDITDVNGQTFRRKDAGTKDFPASITLQYIMKSKPFEDVWRSGCEAHGISTTAADQFNVAPTREWGPKGIAPLNSGATVEKPPQNRPLEPLDGNWLLQQFVDSQEHLEDGGTFRTVHKTVSETSTEDLQNFVAFLQQPEFAGHPWQSWWIGQLGGDHPSQPAVLAKNLPFIRACVQFRQATTVRERFYVLGPRGSALDNPFIMTGNQSCLRPKDRGNQSAVGITPSARPVMDTLSAMRSDATSAVAAQAEDEPMEANEQTQQLQGKKSRKRKSKPLSDEESGMPEPSSKSKKRQLSKKRKTSELEEDVEQEDIEQEFQPLPEKPKKKSRKHKTYDLDEEEDVEQEGIGEGLQPLLDKPKKKSKKSSTSKVEQQGIQEEPQPPPPKPKKFRRQDTYGGPNTRLP